MSEDNRDRIRRVGNEYQMLIHDHTTGLVCVGNYPTFQEARDAFKEEIDKRNSPFKVIGIEHKPAGFYTRMETPHGQKLVGPFDDEQTAEAKMLIFIANHAREPAKDMGGSGKAGLRVDERPPPLSRFIANRKKTHSGTGHMARKPRSDGTKFAREAAAELTRQFPLPFMPLSQRAEKYWPRVIGAKLLSAWTEVDLDTAWGLCEDLAKLEELRVAVRNTPGIYKDDKGAFRENPALKVIEKLERRIQATKRHLQINSAATNGKSEHQGKKNTTARVLAQTITDIDSDLIARPLLN